MQEQNRLSPQVERLLARGVRMPLPQTVEVGEEVDPGRISGDGVVLHAGTRISGARTLIAAGCRLGQEAPVSLSDCLLGPGVELKGGFFKSSVFLEKANMASGAQVREGCLLEEEANGSHTVGLKQTLLFPFVTLGSLINFCDCFMAGGTSRKNHSEVGSSYIHFNYTPQQDKATASLLGDVPRGVMLKAPPIFLGGQGGLVGPARIGYGTVIAAGTVWRGDCPEGGALLSATGRDNRQSFTPGLYGDIRRRVLNNLHYIANLLALRQWYLHVRQPFFRSQDLGAALFDGATQVLESALAERIVRFEALAEKMETSLRCLESRADATACASIVRQQRALLTGWPRLKAFLTSGEEASTAPSRREAFVKRIAEAAGTSGYLAVVQSLDAATAAAGTAWLQDIVDTVVDRSLSILPECR